MIVSCSFQIPSDYFRVVFQGIGAEGLRDNIALDDIRIANCKHLGTCTYL